MLLLLNQYQFLQHNRVEEQRGEGEMDYEFRILKFCLLNPDFLVLVTHHFCICRVKVKLD